MTLLSPNSPISLSHSLTLSHSLSLSLSLSFSPFLHHIIQPTYTMTSSVDKLKLYLYDHGIRTRGDIAKAIVIHELVGISILSLSWVACYRFRPLYRLTNLPSVKPAMQRLKSMNIYKASMEKVTKMEQKKYFKWLVSRGADPVRLGVSMAEQTLVRKLFSPVFIPFKIWFSLECMQTLHLAREQEELGRGEGEGKGEIVE